MSGGEPPSAVTTPLSALRWVQRAAWALAGGAWFIWLGYEDPSLTTIFAMATLIALASGLTLFARYAGGRTFSVRRWMLLCVAAGALTGLAVGPLTALLILLKTSLHAHGVPRFSAADLLAALARSLVWALIGALAGAAGGLLRLPNAESKA